jgi:hypothetical protein
MSDFWASVYTLQRKSHESQAAQARADLSIAEASDDVTAAAEAAARLLQVENSWAAFHAGAVQHAQSMIPVPEDERAWQSKDLDKMTDADVWRMTNSQSKYTDPRSGGTPISADEYNKHVGERNRRLASDYYGQGRVGRR